MATREKLENDSKKENSEPKFDPVRISEVEDYLKQNMTHYPIGGIKKVLRESGYSDSEINQAMDKLKNTQSESDISTQPPSVSAQPSNSPVEQQFSVDPLGIGILLKNSWYFLKNNALVLTFIPIISVIPWFFFGFFSGALHSDSMPYIEIIGDATATGEEQIEAMKYLLAIFITSPVLIITVLIAMVVGFIGTLAIYRAIVDIDKGQKVGVLTAYKDALPFIFPFYLVSILQGLAIVGGFLLLIIPGIIFAFWFMFSQFSLLADDYRGIEALRHSKDVVKGKVWSILWRIFVVGAILSLIGIPVAIFAYIPFLGDIVQIAFNAICTVYMTIFSYQIYKAVKQVKGMN